MPRFRAGGAKPAVVSLSERDDVLDGEIYVLRKDLTGIAVVAAATVVEGDGELERLPIGVESSIVVAAAALWS